jgi:hypothetical protein
VLSCAPKSSSRPSRLSGASTNGGNYPQLSGFGIIIPSAARPLLAKQYLGEFDLGLISARALFAKRRMGKSTFLERDLIPAAKQAGYITPYLNLWTATHTPAQALLRVVSSAVAPKGWPRLLKRLKGMKSVKTSAALKGIV